MKRSDKVSEMLRFEIKHEYYNLNKIKISQVSMGIKRKRKMSRKK